MSVIYIDSNNYEAEVLNSDKPVLIDFFATWCGPCKMLSPIIDEVAAERPDVKVCKVDIDKNMELTRKFRVMSVPTLVVVKDGKIVSRSSGARPKEDVLALL